MRGIIIIIVLVSLVSAQKQIVIHKKDGSTIIESVIGIDSITFTSDIVAEYLFNGNADDGSGNGNNGTVTGATLTEDRHGNANSAYSFDGVDDYIAVNQISGLTVEQTKSLWIYMKDFNASIESYYPFDEGGNNHWVEIIDKDDDGQPFIRSGLGEGGTYVDGTTKLANDKWYHITVTTNGVGAINVYLDGQLEASTSSGDVNGSPAKITIGTSGYISGFFKGSIDDVRIYNRVLNTEEVKLLFNEIR
ncbi:MAG: LamG domain-containing protein [PVC group bacterium]|nr:LamG domain-containing protein [PVC group bacterium]